jgi:transposase
MGKGKPTNPTSIGKILAHHEDGLSYRKISQLLNISHQTAMRTIKNKDSISKQETRGRKRKTSPADDRLIHREASNSSHSAKKIRYDLGLEQQISKSTLIRRIHEVGYLQNQKIIRRPAVTARHRSQRLEWCKTFMEWKDQWERVLFTDEKKFNLDGPDCWRSYWHDLRKNKLQQKRRQSGGGSVMAWAGFTANLATDIVFSAANINSKMFKTLLEKQVLPIREEFDMLQMDNAAAHVSHATLEYLETHDIAVMKWPANSPDLNPIENLWGTLARAVYRDGRQFVTIKELKDAIKLEWAKLGPNEFHALANSMPNRLFETIKHQGGTTKY